MRVMSTSPEDARRAPRQAAAVDPALTIRSLFVQTVQATLGIPGRGPWGQRDRAVGGIARDLIPPIARHVGPSAAVHGIAGSTLIASASL
jgi:hypothetical protein